MAHPILGQILGSVLGGGTGAAGLGGLGALAGLGGAVGGGGGLPGAGPGDQRGMGRDGLRGGGAGRQALLLALLPLAMQWMRSRGGAQGVVQQLGQQAYGHTAASWLGTGANDQLSPEAVQQVVGEQDLDGMARQLGVPREEVSHGMAEILPEVVDHLSPQGALHPEADRQLDVGQSTLQRLLGQLH